MCVAQVYCTGKLVSFTKNNLEVCYKSCIEHHEVGIDDAISRIMVCSDASPVPLPP